MRKGVKGTLCPALAAALMMLLTFAASAGAAEKATTAAQPRYGGTLRVLRMTGPGSPIGVPWETLGMDAIASTPALESLMREYPDRRFEPFLATGWQVASDMKSITITLRKGVKFHDGTNFDAEAVKFNLDGYKAAKRPETAGWTTVQVINDSTVKIGLSRYTNTMMDDLANMLLISPTAFKTKGIEWARWNPVGTGPFEFVSFERDVRAKFKKFASYWQTGKPYLDGLEFLYVRDQMTQAAAMETGAADVQSVVLGKITADMQAQGFWIAHQNTANVSLFPDSANSDSPFADKRVRAAMEYAINREAIVKALGYGFIITSYQVPVQGKMAYTPELDNHKYDPERAKKLLAEAGYAKGFKVQLFPQPGTEKDFLVAVQGYLAKVGITVELNIVDIGKYIDLRKRGWKNTLLIGPLNTYTNVGETLETYFLNASNDYTSVKKPAGLEEAIRDAVSSLEPNIPKLQKAMRIINEESTVIPLYVAGAGYAHAKYVHDTGFLTLAGTWAWTPERAWLSK